MASNIKTIASSSTTIPDEGPLDLENRLYYFVKYFVTELEATLKLHYDILEVNVKKAGEFPELLGAGLCTVPFLGSGFGKLFQKSLEKPFEIREKFKSLQYHNIVYWFHKWEEEARSRFVSISIDVFKIYEFQYIGVTSDRGTQKAMKRLAKDAAQRFMNSYKSEEEELKPEDKKSFSFKNIMTPITKQFTPQIPKSEQNVEMNARRVVEGKSKSISIVGIPVPFKNPGYEIQYKCSVCDKLNDNWKTSSLFDEVGVAVKKQDEVDYELYVGINCKCEKYGYRRNLSGEDLENYKVTEKCKINCRQPRFIKSSGFYKSQHALILNKINDGDAVAVQRRIKELAEEILKQTKEGIEQLKDQQDETKKQLETLVEKLENIINNGNKEILKSLESAQADREENTAVIKETVITAISLLTKDLNEKFEKRDTNERILFRLNKPVKSFEGRTEALKSVHSALENRQKTTVISQAAAIFGLGGIGKTELAKKYAEAFMDDYHNIIFINAEKRETTLESFKELAKRVGINLNEKEDVKRERKIENVIEDIYIYFNKSGKTLMVFDNVEDYCDVKMFISTHVCESNNIYTLITSRCRDWDVGQKGDFVLIHLNGFTEEEAMDYLVKALETENKDDLMTLITVLEKFPLALKQAVGYIQQQVNSKRKRKGLTVKDYLRLYEEQKAKLLNGGGKHVDDVYTPTVVTTWRITMKKIGGLGDSGMLAMSIFNIMVYLAPDNVDIEKLFFKLENDEDKLYNAVELLDKYCLINLDDGIANVHRLVQESTKIYLMEKGEEEAVLRDALMILDGTDCEEHIVSVWEHSSKYPQLVKNFYSSSVYGYYEETPIHLLASYQKNCIAISNILKHVDCINRKDKINDTPLHNASRNGNIDVVKFLIEQGARLNLNNHYKETPLHYAASYGHIEVVKYLIDKDYTMANQKDDENNTPVDLAVINGHISVAENLRPQNNDPYIFFARFNNVVLKNDFDQCKEMIEIAKQTNLLQSLFLQSNALHVAASNCDDKMIKYLVDCGFDINSNNNRGETPLMCAAKNKKNKEIKLMLELGADLTNINNSGNTALHYLAKYNAFEEFEFLLSKGADFNYRSNNNLSALHWAAKVGSLEILELLISKGMDINMTDKWGNTPLINAAACAKSQALKLLLKLGADLTIINKSGETALHFVAESDAVEEFELLLNEGADLNCRNNDDSSTFHWAANAGSLKTLQMLSDKGVDINMTDKWGNTPLINAASSEKYRALKLLLELGADLTIINKTGETALYFVVKFNAVEEFELLLSKGADLIYRNENDSSTLHWAAEAGSFKILQLLYDKEVDINMTNKNGHTPLIIAAFNKKYKAVKLLLKLGADPTISNENGSTALHYIAESDAVEEFELLISNGAILTATDKNDSSPLHVAAHAGSLKILQLLFKRGVDINMTSKYGSTSLMIAASVNKSEALKLLLKLGADPKISNENGNTALHYVAKYDAVEEFKLLLNKGADFNCRDNDGFSPLHWATQAGSHKILQLLFDKGVDINMPIKDESTSLKYNRTKVIDFFNKPLQATLADILL